MKLTIVNINYQRAVSEAAKLGHFVPIEIRKPIINDESILIVSDREVVCVLPLTYISGTACHFDETSIVPIISQAWVKCEKLYFTIVNWAKTILSEGCVNCIKILSNEFLSAAFGTEKALRTEDNTRIYGYFDLRRQEEELWSKIRRRYRSHINKGKTKLHRMFPNITDQQATGDLKAFLSSNLELIGHGLDVTYFNEHLRKCREGAGTLFSYLDSEGKLVGVVGIAKWAKFSPQGDHFYEIGGYDHRFEIPLHFCLYDAMSYYRDRNLGNRIFLLHGVPKKRSEYQVKLSTIDHFKTGLCSDLFERSYIIVRAALL